MRILSFLLVLVMAHGAALARSGPPPIADFFDNSPFSGAVLSPDAKSLAVRISSDKARDRLAVFDIASNKLTVVGQLGRLDVSRFEWVNNDRLVFDSTDKSVNPGDAQYAPGLFAVNRDGTQFRQLVHIHGDFVTERRMANKILPWNHFLVHEVGAQNSDEVYVTSARHVAENHLADVEYVNLLRLDTISGRTTGIARPGASRTWMLDHKGEPRLSTVVDKNQASIMYLDPATRAWRVLASYNPYVGGSGEFHPLGFSPSGALYVVARVNKDKSALHTFDLQTNKLNPVPVVELADFDFVGSLVTSENKLLGVRYLSDARATVWFDEGMKKAQATVDAALPNTVNMISVAARPATPWVLVHSYSDLQPSQYALFNTDTGAINPVGATHPNIKPTQMAEQELVRYKARDGLMIPAWLTVPRGTNRKNLPLVVMVHGGPFLRGQEWGWDAEVQFLASRGYAVLEPEFRGSTGFGLAHFKAGWKQWGLAMQNDIADGTRWAIAEGIANPKRVCIAGASYGGYATLMGLINDPDLYKCGINWVGVTDIGLMYSGHWSYLTDFSDNYLRYGMPTLVGDPVKDAAQLKATSPLAQAARVRQPLLMAYGALDKRVPLYHGKQFHDAVKDHNKQVEWVLYGDEAHGWRLPKNQIDFWERVERFLQRHIGTQ